MKKILTAINNPKLNEELKKEKNFEVIGKDIQYKEAIIEILEKNNQIDLIIMSEKIPGEIKLEKLIEKIKLINEKIKIIFILEKENNDLEKILIKNNIIDIYYNNKINLNELIEIINKKEINMEEEIIKLKKIIEEKDMLYHNENKKYKNKRKEIRRKQEKKIKNKIITFSGNYKSGKTTLTLIIAQYLAKENNKVLMIDGDLEKQDLSTILKNIRNKTKYNKIVKNKVKKNQKNYSYNYEIKNKIDSIKINNNLYLFNKLNYFLENKKEEKTISKVLEKEKQNYNFIIIDLTKTNPNIINQEILEKSDLNFIMMEPNILGIKEIKRLINTYLEEWKIKEENLYLIINKKNNISINKKIILKVISFKNHICEIKENKKYSILMKNYFYKFFLLKNKKIKKEINKIIYYINN